MMFAYSAAAIPASVLLGFAAALFLLTWVTPHRPVGELVPIADLLTEEDDS
jgi:hypothetical protein